MGAGVQASRARVRGSVKASGSSAVGIAITVDSGVGSVGDVAIVRTVVRRAARLVGIGTSTSTNTSTEASSRRVGGGVVGRTVTVDTRVGSVSDVAVVGAVVG